MRDSCKGHRVVPDMMRKSFFLITWGRKRVLVALCQGRGETQLSFQLRLDQAGAEEHMCPHEALLCPLAGPG